MKLTATIGQYTLVYDWSYATLKQRVKCAIRHDWEVYQDCFTGEKRTVVIAFKVCKRCAKSKLIHILA